MHNPYFAEESEWAAITIEQTDIAHWRSFLESAKQTALAEVQWEVFYSDIVKRSYDFEGISKPWRNVTMKVSVSDAAWVIPMLHAFIENNGGHSALKKYLDILDKPGRRAFVDEIRRIYVYGWTFIKFTVKMHQGMA